MILAGRFICAALRCDWRSTACVVLSSLRLPGTAHGQRDPRASRRAVRSHAWSRRAATKPTNERDSAAFDRCYSAGMWTEVLAIYAAVVSTSSVAISYLSYRSGGPQLSGSAEIYGRYDIEGPKLHVDVHNRGRMTATMLAGCPVDS